MLRIFYFAWIGFPIVNCELTLNTFSKKHITFLFSACLPFGMRSNTGWLFAKAREDAISKVIGEELKGYARVMDLNNEGLEKLVPASRDAMLVHLQDTLSERCQDYVRGLNALIAFDGVDPNVLQQASGYLEKQGVFCYMEETTFRDWAYLYSSLLP